MRPYCRNIAEQRQSIRALYHGEAETGVTVIHMTPQLDAGPMLIQRRMPIGPTETAPG